FMSSNGYYVYMDKCLLPITPKRIFFEIGNSNKSIELSGGREVNVLNDSGLTEVGFSFIIPQSDYPFFINKMVNKGAKYYIDYLRSLKESKKPFQFIVSRSRADGRYLFSTNIKVSLEDYTFTEDAENGLDIVTAVRLKQFRDHGVKRIKLSLGGAHQENSRADSSVSAKPIMIGSDVILNGRLYGSSYGDTSGQMRTNYNGKVNFINLKGTHPYHITTPAGLWQGWVTKESVRAFV
ncbi:MAG: hypothetical protein K2K41_03655, partial [Ruminiclostridium sp.]|nr:hypothetical protein [Ruminiclostridium sp.]